MKIIHSFSKKYKKWRKKRRKKYRRNAFCGQKYPKQFFSLIFGRLLLENNATYRKILPPIESLGSNHHTVKFSSRNSKFLHSFFSLPFINIVFSILYLFNFTQNNMSYRSLLSTLCPLIISSLIISTIHKIYKVPIPFVSFVSRKHTNMIYLYSLFYSADFIPKCRFLIIYIDLNLSIYDGYKFSKDLSPPWFTFEPIEHDFYHTKHHGNLGHFKSNSLA